MSDSANRPRADFTPLFIPVAYSLFHASGSWPTVRAIHRRLLTDSGLDVPIREVVAFFRQQSGAVQGPDAVARLNVNELQLVPQADTDLRHVVSAVSLAVKAYWESESPKLTSDKAIESLGLTPLEARRLYELLSAEYWLWRGSNASSDNSSWSFEVGDDVHLLRDVKTVSELLTKKADILGEDRSLIAPRTLGQQPSGAQRDPRTVFMVRGRNDAAADALQDFLAALGLRVISWSEAHSEATKRTGMASPFVLEIVRSGIEMAQAVVVLMTPDDEVRLMDQFAEEHDESESSGQARPNVVLELGMSLALYPQRTLLVSMGRLRSISDLGGIFQTRLDNSPAKRQFLHDRLRDCDCDVNLQGRWKEAGDFAAALSMLRDSSASRLAVPEQSKTIDTSGAAGFVLGVDSSAATDEKPGFMDVLADGEAAFERVVGVMEQATEVMGETTALALASAEEIKAVDARGGGLRARLAVVVRHAESLAPLADRYDELSQTYLAEWRDIQSAMEYLVQQIETDPEARATAIELKFPTTVATFADSVVGGAEQLNSLARTLDQSGSASKVLRPVTSKMSAAARRWSEPVPVVKDWRERLDRLGL